MYLLNFRTKPELDKNQYFVKIFGSIMLHSEWDRPRHSQFEFALKYEKKDPPIFCFLIISEPQQTTRSNPLCGRNNSGCWKKILFNNTALTVKSDDFRFSRTFQFSLWQTFGCLNKGQLISKAFFRLQINQKTSEIF